MIKTVIIDDEADLREVNRRLLLDNFLDVEVAGEADSVESGIELIKKVQPQLVLLDIEIKGGTGFHILQKVKPYTFKVIFITAFNEFAIKAIKFSALDYVLKPVNEVEFCQAIEKALVHFDTEKTEMQFDNFFDHYEKQSPDNKKMVLRTSDSVFLVNLSDIKYCKSDNSYTVFHIRDKKNIMVSRSIKEYAELLEEYDFCRPHQSFLVNINYIEKLDKTDGGFIILEDKTEIPVSTRRKQAIMQILDKL
jgi:two-component system, LytTR family, response regulator